MAIRVRAQLRKWFGRGMYPTAEQFSDLFDSFFHKTEDKIPMSGVEGLTDQLNGKYNTAEGRELEKKVQKVTDDLSVHVASSEKAFNEVQNDIEALDGRLDDEIERAKGEEAAIRRELAAGDAATLSSAKSYTDTSVAAEAGKREQGDATTLQAAKTYTDTSVAAEAEERTQGDATTLSSAKTYTDTSVADEAQKRGQGDAATLQSANSHADAAVASEKSARESGDRTTLESAKAYVDKAIAELVDGSPAALDTLKELSAALGNDPNFATTVATQIGQKVDKVAGKGLSTEDYTSEEKAKLAGVAAGANNYQHPATHPATMIEQDASHRFVTDTEKTTWNGKASTAVVTQSANGLMSAADKKKLDGVAAGANNYQHPATHPASVIVQDSTHRFVTDTEKTTWNGKASTAWNTLAYASDVEKVPALRWKVQGGMLYVKPATDPADPILKRCSVGILHYKNARVRKSSAAKLRPTSSGFKLVQDRFSRDELSWTSTRIDPIPFESDKADKSGWLPVISVEALFGRWVTRISDTSYCGKVKFDLHRGINICGRGAGQDEFGKLKMYVSFYSGVVLFVGDAQRRIEGPRSYFKVAASNCGLTPSVLHI